MQLKVEKLKMMQTATNHQRRVIATKEAIQPATNRPDRFPKPVRSVRRRLDCFLRRNDVALIQFQLSIFKF
jgi:hypothetical protein